MGIDCKANGKRLESCTQIQGLFYNNFLPQQEWKWKWKILLKEQLVILGEERSRDDDGETFLYEIQ